MVVEKIMDQETGRMVETNTIYRHYKGNLYYVESVAINSDTEELMVIYFSLYGEKMTFVQPLKRFLERLDPEKHNNILQAHRFEKVDKILLSVLANAK